LHHEGSREILEGNPPIITGRWNVERDSHALTPCCVLAACLLLALGGCADRSVGPEGHPYPDQSTPDRVLEKLEMAYEAMDADAYLDCLAEDFLFFVNPDEAASNPDIPEYWEKADELTIHRNMFPDTTAIESVELTLTVVSRDSLPGQDPDDPADDVWEYLVDVDLRIQAGLTYLSSGASLFVMRRSSDFEDVVWQIIEHHDLGDEGIQREEASWTAIKLVLGGVEDALYPIRSSPRNVIRKLVLAYERMDAEAYLDCLAENFVFFLNPDDVNEDPEHPLPEHWNKAEEETIHWNMFGEDTVVEGISLVLTPLSETFDEGNPADPLDDTWTLLEAVDLRVHVPPGLMLLATTPSEYVIGVDPDDAGYGGVAFWEITTWLDLSGWSDGRSDPAVEHVSWTGIKALYR
jgi:ketosteroid isomerase-like protein